MTDPRHAPLAWLLTFAVWLLQTGAAPDGARGPYHGQFIPDGVGLKKTLGAEDAPLRGDSRWSLYCWVKSDAPAAARTLLAGFGDPAGEAGTRRYLAARAGRLAFSTGGAEVVFDMPHRGVVLVKLALADEAGRVLSENFYWHAPRPAGYRELNDLAPADVALSTVRRDAGGAARVEVGLVNRGPSVALALQAVLRDAADGARVLPAYYSDNFFSLLPGERRTLAVEVPAGAARGEMVVELKG